MYLLPKMIITCMYWKHVLIKKDIRALKSVLLIFPSLEQKINTCNSKMERLTLAYSSRGFSHCWLAPRQKQGGAGVWQMTVAHPVTDKKRLEKEGARDKNYFPVTPSVIPPLPIRPHCWTHETLGDILGLSLSNPLWILCVYFSFHLGWLLFI